ncbi:MAG: hypothetical protein FJW79_12255 [Actinobacteria bacterium]|nr:hypothetical protein [Actinomycetota bacterium]
MGRHQRTGPGTALLRWGAVLLLGIVGIMVPPTPADAAGDPGQFFDGQIVYSTITNCISIIQGAPYSEFGAGTYVGAYADPDESPPIPGVGQTFYMHVVVYGLGNSCSGQYFVPAIGLPAGVSFDTAQPILCFTGNGQATSLSDCPQWGNTAPSTYGGDLMYLSTDTSRAQTWPLPQGGFWEFRFPIKSTGLSPASGMGPLCGELRQWDGTT